jgi:hypothetical protein
MNMRDYLKLRGFLLAAALVLVCQPAFAARRVALVLGNSGIGFPIHSHAHGLALSK